MVEFRSIQPMMAPLTDTRADVVAMANAFRAASDDDNRNVMNAISNQSTTALESLKFYAVTNSWFVRAWPILTAKPNEPINDNIREDLRDYIGEIRNLEIVLVNTKSHLSMDGNDEGRVRSNCTTDENAAAENNGNKKRDNHSSLSDIEKSKMRINEFHRRTIENPETTQMKPGLLHTRDYFFLGPSAWMLVKNKFGYDGYEICRRCKKIEPQPGQERIAVALLPAEENKPPVSLGGNGDENTITFLSTIIPLSGRFPYEKMFSTKKNTGDSTDTTIRSIEMKNENFSDEKEEIDYSSKPILLLPPSTTEFQKGCNEELDPLLSPVNINMEVDLNESTGQIDSAICTTQVSGRKRLASGLSNMGNTCFMNSTLQCLAHTENLRRYFLSGEYKKDLNRDNPLGTGGELATQFASLMSEMWSEPSKRRNVIGETQNWKYTSPSSHSVYPRSFKNSLGKHAEQFMGYDQHDSQELATYLLDALHEDTNRITKKPYVEKPEQGKDESDVDAADKAWKMHLRREDSRVLENFMGQVKSRLECCEDECKRVSTTFDPFMYLSVPIPGENEKTVHVTFVPLDPKKKMIHLDLIVAKTAMVADLLQKMNEELVKTASHAQPVPLQDLCPVEIYDKEIFKWHELEDDVGGIKEYDTTYIYQLKPLEEVKKIYNEDEDTLTISDDWCTIMNHRFELDLSSKTELDKGDRWKIELERYSKNPLLICRILNVGRSSNEEKIEFYKKLEAFLNECYLELEKDESSKGAGKSTDENEKGSVETVFITNSSERSVKTIHKLIDCSSTLFSNVRTTRDVAVLELCANKLRAFIIDLVHREKEKNSEGITIQVGIRQSSEVSMTYTRRNGLLSTCLVLRLPLNLSVYSLREELAQRLSRSLNQNIASEDVQHERNTGRFTEAVSEMKTDAVSPEMSLLRRARLSYDNQGRGSNGKSIGLGMMHEDEMSEANENGDKSALAIESNEKEQLFVSNTVRNRGRIYLDLEQDGNRKVFDAEEFDSVEVIEDNDVNTSAKTEAEISVLDCIENYCKKEQLEESEMWYCNECKKHVRAWKQFHLYRTPPILIIHLKRFFFSASTHRRDKITRKIDFPLEGLDLTDLVADYGENEQPIYDCYAVSNHFGGLGGGHYTAYVLSDDGTWCNYDDSCVTTDINPAEVVSEAAYVLYYRRRDVPLGRDRDLIVETQISPMICEQADVHGEVSEVSSSNSAQAGDMDLMIDDTYSNGSSKTALSPMESIDNDHNIANNIVDFAQDRPLQ